MSTHTRRKRLIELINSRGECSVDVLVRGLKVSGMTIRRDLQALAADGRIIRTHGGATSAPRVSFEFQFLDRIREHQAAKQAIAAIAAELVRDGQSVMLDSGTTTLALALCLKARKDLQVITTSLPIASELQFCENLQVLLLGGFLRRGAPDLAGALTEANLDNLRSDVAFIGADAVDRKGNIYNASIDVGRMLTRMAASAGRVYVVADSSKLGRTALMKFGQVARWNGLITDNKAEQSIVLALKRAGVHVIRADVKRNEKP